MLYFISRAFSVSWVISLTATEPLVHPELGVKPSLVSADIIVEPNLQTIPEPWVFWWQNPHLSLQRDT